MEQIVIKVENAQKTYRSQKEALKAVKGISFIVRGSTCFGLLGPNGAGKTSLMKMIYGASIRDNVPNSSISVFGFDPVKDELQIKYLCGVVPQTDNLDQELTVKENLLIYAKLYGINKTIANKTITDLLDFMELTDKANANIKELSGGMKRRLVISRALINKPKLLILDEPTTGLDPQVRHMLWNKLRQLKKEGITILITTHYMDEAFQLCDELIIMDQGKKVIEGTTTDLIKNNIEAYVLEIREKNNVTQLKINPDSLKDIRKEIFLNNIYLYSDNYKTLKNITDNLDSINYHLRHSNLEDIFLKTTGRYLNEIQ
ncbi:MAG: ABC transporter ATP-binding protein [Candidatus Magnetoovum sp. WYHC-5]|nr:ABC transporter ATP-binding protein [Candidatus Magnetoovum sp. WYHC-5]